MWQRHYFAHVARRVRCVACNDITVAGWLKRCRAGARVSLAGLWCATHAWTVAWVSDGPTDKGKIDGFCTDLKLRD